MKRCSSLLAFAAIASTIGLVSCAGPSGYNYKNVVVSLSFNPGCSGVCVNTGVFLTVPKPTNPGDLVGPVGAIEMPIGSGGSGSCVELTASITNAPPNFTWTILPSLTPAVPGAGSGTTYPPTQAGPNIGTLAYTTGATNYYCVPNSVPIYTGAAWAQAQALGIQQGETVVQVSAPADPNNPAITASATQAMTFQGATLPSQILVGMIPSGTLSIPLNSTFQFQGYVVGANGYRTLIGVTNPIPAQAQTWYVTAPGGSAVAGGNATIGTISSTGLYTAPAAYPTSAKTVTISLGATSSAVTPTIVTGGSGQGSSTIITFQ
jgi:hypothetical protein